MAIGVAAAGFAAQGNKGGKAGKGGGKKHGADVVAPAAPADGEATFVGTLAEVTKKNKKGDEIKSYTVTTDTGEKITIAGKAAKDLNVADLLNQKVKLVGKGEKKGKNVSMGSVTSLTKAE
jgi:hypothetical protein